MGIKGDRFRLGNSKKDYFQWFDMAEELEAKRLIVRQGDDDK